MVPVTGGLRPIQWNPSILATLGTEIIGQIIEVATFQGLIYTLLCM